VQRNVWSRLSSNGEKSKLESSEAYLLKLGNESRLLAVLRFREALTK